MSQHPRSSRATGGVAADPVDVRGLLRRYAPVLRYDSLESFRADSAAILPESYVPAPTGWSATNTLKRKGGTVLGAAKATPGQPTLTLEFLAPRAYLSGATVRSDDLLDAVGHDYVADARRMHAKPGYADVSHGKVARQADGTVWLQYWFFYYDNDKTFLGVGAHEGDWEMIQLRLGPDTVPTDATYAQHSGGEALRWSELERVQVDGYPVPVVYPGRGSHASFASAGDHYPVWPFPDYADGRGPEVRPRVVIIGDAAPPWATWPGTWGSSDSSPPGPSRHGQWHDPASFHGEAERVTARTRAARAARAAPPPPAPMIAVHRVEDRAVVGYRFPARLRAGASRPARIVVSVDSPDDDLPPATYAFPVRAQRGLAAHPLPIEGRRYLVRAFAANGDGVASPVVHAPVPPPRRSRSPRGGSAVSQG
jgi:hypothetical protein